MAKLKEKIVRSRYLELTEDERHILDKAITLFEKIVRECDDCIIETLAVDACKALNDFKEQVVIEGIEISKEYYYKQDEQDK